MELSKKIANLFEKNNTLRGYLFLSNFLLVLFAIIFFNMEVLPLKNIGDFSFLIFIVFLFSLYRPGWAFLFFIGSIVLEIINLSPEKIGIALRPYQIFGALGALAVAIRFFSRRLNFNLPKFNWNDWALAIFSISGFLSILFSANKNLALKQSLVIFSFFVLYLFSRIFIQNIKDIKKIFPFFLGSSFILIIYSIWQNLRFLSGKNHFEVMPGRPNGTFSEADWLGMFLVFLLSILYPIAYNFYREIDFYEIKYRMKEFTMGVFVWMMIVLSYIALILTVSRSAWLGALAVFLVFSFYIIRDRNYNLLGAIIGSFIISIGIVYVFNLTNFELGNRIQSTGTGLQEITISCDNGVGNWKPFSITEPLVIENINELDRYRCQHINLEDIDREVASGQFVTVALRKDPNFNLRGEIYKKSWEQIKINPIFGIGWGNISNVLGNDERGAGLNSSNIFLEIWLGAGLIGLLSFLFVLGNIFYKSLKAYNDWRVFIQLSLVAIIIPNLFNAGIMLGFMWVWMAIAQIEE